MSRAAAISRADAGASSRFPGRRARILALIAALAAGLLLAEIAYGPVRLTLDEIVGAVIGEAAPATTVILIEIRAPRALLAILVGAALGLSGACLQGVLRNPLADPGLIGVSAGATVGAVSVIVLGEALFGGAPDVIRPYLLPVAAFFGAAAATGFVFFVARGRGGVSVATVILAGVAVNAIAGAFVGAMVYLSDDAQLRELTFWTMGSLGGARWAVIGPTLIFAAPASLLLARRARGLDLFQLGERAARHSGIDVEREKRRIGALTALAVGAVTAAAGPISFIGLVAPHISRLLVGPNHAAILPGAALSGAALTLGADLLVRTAMPPAEPPIGLATALIGGPFFLWLIVSRMGRSDA
ncbi:iron ABC transporter permease [Pikeienuella piscinae]|uniref:Iron ABC transporter permease n=1 Tax=Pikeienuella piscinae TaxID=2748098 RepID=A0A7L5C198_9RHOB|nr:iron ABC transporter permease [Pikeienuella piscinae]QIE55629.1 iron ABC transporter permease [Pikeienuella piscinae]